MDVLRFWSQCRHKFETLRPEELKVSKTSPDCSVFMMKNVVLFIFVIKQFGYTLTCSFIFWIICCCLTFFMEFSFKGCALYTQYIWYVYYMQYIYYIVLFISIQSFSATISWFINESINRTINWRQFCIQVVIKRNYPLRINSNWLGSDVIKNP